MKPFYKNSKGALYQIAEKTPCYDMAKLLYNAVRDVDNYLVEFFIKNSIKNNEFLYKPNN